MQHRGFRSSITIQGRQMAGARALWRAIGMKKEMLGFPLSLALSHQGRGDCFTRTIS